MSKTPGLRQRHIVARTGLSLSSVKRALAQLKGEGLVLRRGDRASGGYFRDE